MNNAAINTAAVTLGRVLLSIIFIVAGFGKLADSAGTAGYMSSVGVPGILVWPTIVVELGGGLLILIGYQTRIVSFILAGFTLVAALIFHNHLADQNQMIHFMKNLAITGGFLALLANGAGSFSVDGRANKG